MTNGFREPFWLCLTLANSVTAVVYGLELRACHYKLRIIAIAILYLFTEPDEYVTLTTDMSSTTNCIEIKVLDDDLVGGNEIIRLHLTSNDSTIMLVEPTIAEIIIINTDGTSLITSDEHI